MVHEVDGERDLTLVAVNRRVWVFSWTDVVPTLVGSAKDEVGQLTLDFHRRRQGLVFELASATAVALDFRQRLGQ